MDNNQNQQGQQLQIDLSPEVAKGIYTNFQIISLKLRVCARFY